MEKGHGTETVSHACETERAYAFAVVGRGKLQTPRSADVDSTCTPVASVKIATLRSQDMAGGFRGSGSCNGKSVVNFTEIPMATAMYD